MLGIMEIAQLLGRVNEVIQSIDGASVMKTDDLIESLRNLHKTETSLKIDAGAMADLIETLQDNGLVSDE